MDDNKIGKTYKAVSSCGNVYITINRDDKGKICEVWVHFGKSGGCERSFTAAIASLISMLLLHNESPFEIVKTLKGISCRRASALPSCIDAIGTTLERDAQGG